MSRNQQADRIKERLGVQYARELGAALMRLVSGKPQRYAWENRGKDPRDPTGQRNIWVGTNEHKGQRRVQIREPGSGRAPGQPIEEGQERQRQGEEQPQEGQKPASPLEQIGGELRGLNRDQIDAQTSQAIAGKLATLSLADLKQLKASLGIPEGGPPSRSKDRLVDSVLAHLQGVETTRSGKLAAEGSRQRSLFGGPEEGGGAAPEQANPVEKAPDKKTMSKEEWKAYVASLPVPEHLPFGHEQYFTMPEGAMVVPLDRIRNIRARPEGVANAAKFMEASRVGKMDKRAPIKVVKEDDGTFTVADGNSTFANAKANGWESLPVQVVGRDFLEAEKKKTFDKESAKARKELAPEALFSQTDLSLPKSDDAPATNWHSFEEAQRIGSQVKDNYDRLVDRGEGIDKLIGGEAISPTSEEGFMDALYEMQNDDRPRIILAPNKSRKSCERKVNGELHGNWAGLKDMVRGTVVVNRLSDVPGLMTTLRAEMEKNGWTLYQRPKDRFADEAPGYKDINLVLRDKDGNPAELQINTKINLLAKERHGHKLYEAWREIDPLIRTGVATQEQENLHKKLSAEMAELYNASWGASLGLGNDELNRIFDSLGFRLAGSKAVGKVPAAAESGRDVAGSGIGAGVPESSGRRGEGADGGVPAKSIQVDEREVRPQPGVTADPQIAEAMKRYENRGQRSSSGGLFGGEDLRAREGFGKLPNGAKVVMTEGEHAGRKATLTRETGPDGRLRIVARIDGVEGSMPVTPTSVEPLNAAQSWRTEAGEALEKKQGGLFSAENFLPKRTEEKPAEAKPVETKPSAEPPAPAGTQPPSSNLAVAKAMAGLLDKPGGRYNLVSLADLQEASGLPRDEFVKAVNAMRREGILSGSTLEGRHGASQRDLAAQIADAPDSKIGYVSVRDEGDGKGMARLRDLAGKEKHGKYPEPPVATTPNRDTMEGGGEIKDTGAKEKTVDSPRLDRPDPQHVAVAQAMSRLIEKLPPGTGSVSLADIQEAMGPEFPRSDFERVVRDMIDQNLLVGDTLWPGADERKRKATVNVGGQKIGSVYIRDLGDGKGTARFNQLAGKSDKPAAPAAAAPATPASPSAPAAGGRHVVVGNTFPAREAIKALGGKWDPDRKQWTIPAENASRLPRGLTSRPVGGGRSAGTSAPQKPAVSPTAQGVPEKSPLRLLQDAGRKVRTSGRTGGQSSGFTRFVGNGKRHEIDGSSSLPKVGEIIPSKEGPWMITKVTPHHFVSSDYIDDNDDWDRYKNGAGWYASYEAVPVEMDEAEKAEVRKQQEAKDAEARKMQEAESRWEVLMGGRQGTDTVPADLPKDLKWEKVWQPKNTTAYFVATLPDGRTIGKREWSTYDDWRTTYYPPAEQPAGSALPTPSSSISHAH